MKHKLLSLGLTLALCLGLTIPAAAAEQIITVGDETYDRVMAPLLAMETDEPVTLVLGSDIQLTGYSVVLGTSDYGGMFEEPVTIVSHDVTIDLNGYTITGEEGYALFEVQDGYTLTIVDNSEAKTGALVTQGDEVVAVAEGGTYNALPAAEETPTEEIPAEETPAEETPAANPFTDVAETSPYLPGILWAVGEGITNGRTDTTFAPYENCSRANIITFLWRAAGSPEPETQEAVFTDVTDSGAYYYNAVQWAGEQGMAEGETFAPNDPCTRAMAVEFMWKAAGSPEVEASSFTDVAADADYAAAVNWAVAQGVTMGTGDGTTFSPDQVCQRGQIVTFLYRAAQAETAAE